MAYTAHHIMARRKQRSVLHKPADAATAQLVDLGQPQGASIVMTPIANFRRWHAEVLVCVLGGTGIVAFSIYCGTDAAGSGATEVVAHALGDLPNAIQDSVNLECDVEQVKAALATATHVGVWLDCQHNDDEIAVAWSEEDPRFPRANLTADYVA